MPFKSTATSAQVLFKAELVPALKVQFELFDLTAIAVPFERVAFAQSLSVLMFPKLTSVFVLYSLFAKQPEEVEQTSSVFIVLLISFSRILADSAETLLF